jgi:hypothetical protein
MGKRATGLLVVTCLLLVRAPVVQAQQQPRMIEIAPFYGYQLGGNSTVREGDLDLESGSNVGFTVDVTLLEERDGIVQLEFFYSRQMTTLQLRPYGTGVREDLADLAIEYYHGGLLYLFKTDHVVRPFGSVTLGGTRAAPEGSSLGDEWYVSFAFAGGAKAIGKSGIGVRFQGRLLMPILSSSSGIWCGFPGGCGVNVGGHVTVQADVQAGLIVGL